MKTRVMRPPINFTPGPRRLVPFATVLLSAITMTAPNTKSVDRFVSYPAFHHALMIRNFIGDRFVLLDGSEVVRN